MHLEIVVHESAEGGFWAEVPALPGCFSQGDTLEELQANLRDAIESHAGTTAPMTLSFLRAPS